MTIVIIFVVMLMTMRKRRTMKRMSQESESAAGNFLDLRAEKFEVHESP